MITCDRYGQIFYSDTEYREHRLYEDFLEQQKQLVKEVVESQTQGWIWLASALRTGIVVQIMRQEGLDFETAFRRYLEYGDIANRVLEEKARKGGTNG